HRQWQRESRRPARDLPHVGAARPRGWLLQLLRVPERSRRRGKGGARGQRADHRPRRRAVERPRPAPPLRDPRPGRDRARSHQLVEDAQISVKRRAETSRENVTRRRRLCAALLRDVVCVTLFAACHRDASMLRVSGTVEIREVQLASLAAGRLVRLLKDEGDTVRQGDTLAVLEQPGLDALISQRRAQAKAAGLRTAEVIAAGTPVASLGLVHRPWIRAYVGERFIARLKVGQPATIRVDGYPDRPFAGRVAEIASQAEFTPRAALTERERADLVFGIKVEPDSGDAGGRLKAGMPVTLELPLLP